MSGIGRLSSQYQAARGGHDVRVTVGQWAKVVANIILADADAAKAVFAKAQAKKDAREAVHSAIRELCQQGVRHSADLDYLGSIINKVVAGDPAAQSEKLGNQGYRIALFDTAWKASIGKSKGIVLLKTDDLASRDGTKALRSGLRSKARADWEKFRAATRLMGLLSDIKNCRVRDATNVPDTAGLMKIFAKHFDTLASLDLWSSKRVKQSFSEYLGLPLSLLELLRTV